MGRTVLSLRVAIVCAVVALTACSGGGGGSSPLPASSGAQPPATTAPSASPSPVATATATTTTTSGFVYDLPNEGTASDPGYSVLGPSAFAVPGAPIAGADVYVGSALVLGAAAPASTPSFAAHATTASDGSWSIAGLVPGTYALTIFAPAPHVAVVHRDLVVAAGPNTPGIVLVATLSPAESAWYAQQSADRSVFGEGPLVIDEAALEAARYWTAFMATNDYFGHCIPESLCSPGDTTPPPASYGPQDVDPQHRFDYFHGFSGAAEGENIAGGFATWELADSAFMAEASNCPNGSPVNCVFSDTTGHFLNIVDAQYAWTGLGLATSATNGTYFDEEFSALNSTRPAAIRARNVHAALRGVKP